MNADWTAQQVVANRRAEAGMLSCAPRPWWESGRSVAALLLFLNATALLWYYFLVDYRWQVLVFVLLFYSLADVAAMTRRA